MGHGILWHFENRRTLMPGEVCPPVPVPPSAMLARQTSGLGTWCGIVRAHRLSALSHCRTRLLVRRTESNTHRRPLLSAHPCASVRQLSRPARQILIRGIVRVHRLRTLPALSHCRTRSLVSRVGTMLEYSPSTASLRPPLCLRPPCRRARYLALARDIVRVRARQR